MTIKNSKKRLIIVDSNSIIHRAYHALPSLTTKKGELVNAVYGFLLVFLKAIKDFHPDFVAATFDFPAPTFRHKKYKEYKAKRPRVPKELYQQIPKVKEVLSAFNVPVFEMQGFEADDIIGTIAHLTPKRQIAPEIETIILSGDSDILQLVNSQTKVYSLRKGVKDTVLYDRKLVEEKYQGLCPKQLVDFKALKGDPSDNIPGVPGIGGKTAIKLIREFGSLENLYSAIISNIKISALNQRLRAKLEEYKEQAFFSRTLVEIKCDAPIDFRIGKCRWEDYDKEKIAQVFKKFDFHSLLGRIFESEEGKSSSPPLAKAREINEKEKKIGENLKLW